MAAVPDRTSPLPLWAQIVDDLRRRLLAGEFEGRFPTDEELTRDYEVSRQTAREAVRHLATEGLVVRERGRGSSVVAPLHEQPLHSLYSLASAVRAGGGEERSEVLAAVSQPATPEVADRLEVDPGADVAFIERLRFAGAEPIALDRSWLPLPDVRGLLEADLSSGGLYELLSAHCALRVSGGSERITPVVPAAAERKLLRLGPKVAAFSIDRLAFVGHRPIEWRESLIRGDRYAFVAQWPSGARPQLALD